MFNDHYFEVEPGVRLRYFDEGEGRPILFVPGWTFGAEVFAGQIEALRDSYRCIAVDPRCHGSSTVTHSGNTYSRQGEDLEKLMQALGLEGVVLVGWSFGALACWSYVRQFGTTRVAASVTLDNSPRAISDDEGEYRAGTLAALQKDHRESLCSQEAYRAFLGGFCDGLLYEGKLDGGLRARLIETSCRIPVEIADALYLDGWLTDERETVKRLDEEVPCLLVVANYRKEAGVPFMRAACPNTEIHAFGMHMMFHEYPDRFNTILREFLQRKVGKSNKYG